MSEIRFNAAVVTVSDRSFRGEREDESGPAVSEALGEMKCAVGRSEIVPDEIPDIRDLLIELTDKDGFDLVVTTGGTGFGPRDVTPEATLEVIERRADALSSLMMMESLKKTPNAALSRAVCGIRGKTLIVNLPGSPKGAVENLQALKGVLEHGLVIVKGENPHE